MFNLILGIQEKKEYRTVTEGSKFPNLIRELRKRLGLWQEQLACQLGVGLHTVNSWNNAWATPLQMVSQPIEQFLQDMAAQDRDLWKQHFSY